MNKSVLLKEAAAKLKTNPKDVPARIDALMVEMKQLQHENESLATKLDNIEAGNLVSKVKEINGVTSFSCKGSRNRYEQSTQYGG